VVAPAAGYAQGLDGPRLHLWRGLCQPEALREGAVCRQARDAVRDVATNADTYSHDGRSGDIDLLLWPVQFSLAYVGYAVVAPFIAYGVEAGLRYSDPATIETRLKRVAADFTQTVIDVDRRPVIPFNRMAEWQPSGRIAEDAPVYSPFIRHRRNLDLG